VENADDCSLPHSRPGRGWKNIVSSPAKTNSVYYAAVGKPIVKASYPENLKMKK